MKLISGSGAVAALLLSLVSPAVAEGDPCAAFRELPIPAADQPTAADRGRLEGCASNSLYALDAEWAPLRDARLCAFLEREADRPPAYGGPGVLMMVYANGLGVQRDYDLARRFACEIKGAPAELERRLEHLGQLAAQGGEPIDLCDDITGGLMKGVCIAVAGKPARDRQLAELQSSWPSAKRDAFAPLQRAAVAYFEAWLQNVAQGDTVKITTEQALEQTFINDLLAFDQGELLQGDVAAFEEADAAVNALYDRVMKALPSESLAHYSQIYGTLRHEGIRTTQRAWLSYRDAWATFGAIAYPNIPTEALLIRQTRLHTAELNELAIMLE